MPSQYFYSENSDEQFSHVIRCQPENDLSHEEGKEWLQDLNRIIQALDFVENQDYERWSLCLFAFLTEEKASEFYSCAAIGLGASHRLSE